MNGVKNIWNTTPPQDIRILLLAVSHGSLLVLSCARKCNISSSPILQTAANEAAVTQLACSTLSERAASALHNKLQCKHIRIDVFMSLSQQVNNTIQPVWSHRALCPSMWHKKTGYKKSRLLWDQVFTISGFTAKNAWIVMGKFRHMQVVGICQDQKH